MTAISRKPLRRSIFGDGSKPSFVTGALWTGLASMVLAPILFGSLQLQTALSPADLQAHETLFGYLAAIFAGFILTALPEWTGRPPLKGGTLVILILAWLAGRLAIAESASISLVVAAGIDLVFLLLAILVTAREAVGGQGSKAWPFVGLLIAFFAGNAIFHLGAISNGSPEAGKRIGIAAAVLAVTLVGGRVFPQPDAAEEQAKFRAVDIAALVLSAVALASWIVLPGFIVTAGLMLIAGIVHAVRLAGWVTGRSAQNTLALVQQVAYGFLPLGFVVIGFRILFSDDAAAGVDVRTWMVSATGILVLAMTSRAGLTDSVRPRAARTFAWFVYAAAVMAVEMRIFGGFNTLLPYLSGAALLIAFAVFTIGYVPVLARPGRLAA
jgi:uncharacterized protein involved in response to NO